MTSFSARCNAPARDRLADRAALWLLPLLSLLLLSAARATPAHRRPTTPAHTTARGSRSSVRPGAKSSARSSGRPSPHAASTSRRALTPARRPSPLAGRTLVVIRHGRRVVIHIPAPAPRSMPPARLARNPEPLRGNRIPATPATQPTTQPFLSSGQSNPQTEPVPAARPVSPQPSAPDSVFVPPPTPASLLDQQPAHPILYPEQLAGFFRALDTLQSLRGSTFSGSSANSALAVGSAPAAAAVLTPTVRVLQFGDSHTAADLFSGEVRARLQARFGDGGLGFQFPGHPFAGYRLAGSSRGQSAGWTTQGNHFNNLGDGSTGLGGIAIATARPGESVSLQTTCTTLQVEFLAQPGGGRLRLTDNGLSVADIFTDTPTGTSPGRPSGASVETDPPLNAREPGTYSHPCTPGTHSFTLTTLDDAPVRLLGLVTEQPGITWECLGINGAFAPLMLRWNQALFAAFLRERNPDLIVLAYGTNEAAQSPGTNGTYVYDFNRLLDTLHRIVPGASILVLGPYDRATRAGRRSGFSTFVGTERIVADQRESCRTHGCAFYDEQTRMGGPGSMLRWAADGLAQGDHTHLTGSGYRLLADALARDLLATYQQPPPTGP